jgi:hypothetical protein
MDLRYHLYGEAVTTHTKIFTCMRQRKRDKAIEEYLNHADYLVETFEQELDLFLQNFSCFCKYLYVYLHYD